MSRVRGTAARTFRSLRRVDGEWQVDLEVAGEPASVRHSDAEEAYGLALLQLVTGEPVLR